jgi:hypothetical protein
VEPVFKYLGSWVTKIFSLKLDVLEGTRLAYSLDMLLLWYCERLRQALTVYLSLMVLPSVLVIYCNCDCDCNCDCNCNCLKVVTRDSAYV